MKHEGRMSGRGRLLVAAALMLVATGAAAQGSRVGYVNSARIEAESVPAARALEALKKEFEPRNKQISDLQAKIAAEQARFEKERDKLQPAELKSRTSAIQAMMRQSDSMVHTLAAEFEARKNERAAKLSEDASAAIKAIAEAGKYDLILQQAVYTRTAIDITDQVLKEMARRAAGKP